MGAVPVPGQDHLDILAAWFSTGYRPVKVLNETGRVERVWYEPESLRIRLRLAGDPLPSWPLSAAYHVSFGDHRCIRVFDAVVHGAAAQPESATTTYRRVCQDSSLDGSQTGGGIFHRLEAGLLTVTVPFSALSGALSGSLDPGTALPIEGARIYASAKHESSVTTFDGARVSFFAPPFVVGSDVPAEVSCADAPGHPDCAPDVQL